MSKEQEPVNLNADPIQVSHAQLERWDEDSLFKSKCPVCDNGVLLVAREGPELNLSRIDRCISCGQVVVYTGIGIGGEKFGEMPVGIYL